MNQAQISRLWVFVSGFLLFYSLNAWIAAQGGSPIFSGPLLKPHGAAAAVTTLPISAFLIAVSSCIGSLYASRSEGPWHERIPIVGFKKIETSSREGKMYQAFIFFIFFILPFFSLVYFWSRLLTAPILLNRDYPGEIHFISAWSWSHFFRVGNPALLCTTINRQLHDPCVDKITFLPGLEPWIFLAVSTAALAALLHNVYRIFSRRGQYF